MKRFLPAAIVLFAIFTSRCSFDQDLFYHEDMTYAEPEVTEEAMEETAEAEDAPTFVVPESPIESVPSIEEVVPEAAVSETEESVETVEEAAPEEAVAEAVPQTIEILGTEHDINDPYIDLSEMTPEDVPAVAEAISALKGFYKINLMKADGTSALSVTDVKTLRESEPDAHFVYEFDLFGKRVSTTDRKIEYINVPIGNEGEEEIRNALSVLDRCEYFLLDGCGIDDEVMAGIRDDFPDKKVVWRIYVANKSALTDDQVIRMTHGINDAVTGPLKYCTEVVYMDLGHDSGITDISFIESMTKLECIILSDAKMKDVTPLSYCPNLTWVELVYCDRMSDMTPIANMPSIRYLNISYSGIRDFSVVENLNLERLCVISIGVSDDELEAYKQRHPDTLAINSGNPYGYAWRYNDYGYTFYWYYADMRKAFRYADPSPGGFKLPDDLIEKREAERKAQEEYYAAKGIYPM